MRIKDFRADAGAGEYRCQATNPFGVADTRANYNVEPIAEKEAPKEELAKAPRFNPGLEDCAFEEGKQILLRCRVEAQPPASITFYKDGVPIRPGDRIRINYNEESGECLLTIDDCLTNDEGDSP